MKNQIINRLSTLKLRDGRNIPNRIVVPPMASQTADTDGNVTDVTLAHYSRLGESQAGLIFVEYSFVHQSGKSEGNQLGVSDDSQISGLKLLSSRIHESGA